MKFVAAIPSLLNRPSVSALAEARTESRTTSKDI
jgi:hypothetical protein